MYAYVLQNPNICLDYICNGIEKEYQLLLERMAYGVISGDKDNICPRKYWFDGSTDIQVAANTFQHPIACYTSGSWAADLEPVLRLPHSPPANIKNPPHPLVMHFVNGNHWEAVILTASKKMIWPCVPDVHKSQWNKLNIPLSYKTCWRYLHIKKRENKPNPSKTASTTPIVVVDLVDADTCGMSVGNVRCDEGSYSA